jgi:hypothetical protein
LIDAPTPIKVFSRPSLIKARREPKNEFALIKSSAVIPLKELLSPLFVGLLFPKNALKEPTPPGPSGVRRNY